MKWLGFHRLLDKYLRLRCRTQPILTFSNADWMPIKSLVSHFDERLSQSVIYREGQCQLGAIETNWLFRTNRKRTEPFLNKACLLENNLWQHLKKKPLISLIL